MKTKNERPVGAMVDPLRCGPRDDAQRRAQQRRGIRRAPWSRLALAGASEQDTDDGPASGRLKSCMHGVLLS